MTNFDGGKSLDVKIGIERAQPAQQFEIPILLQGGMQPADHVHFGDAEPSASSTPRDDFIDRLLESVGVALFRGESAELAGENADVGVVDVTIVDVGGVVAVLSLAHRARHDAERIEIIRSIERQSVLLGNPLPAFDFLRDRPKFIRDQ